MNSAVLIICCLLLTAVQGRKPRIINGTDASVGEIPYQVSLQSYWGTHFCGGSILNEYWIITAAHCFYLENENFTQVVVGTVNLTEPYDMTYRIEKLIIHENYEKDSYQSNDIALIKVVTAIDFSDKVQPVVLPKPHSKVETNSPAIISGWGFKDNGPDEYMLPKILQKATVFITSQTVCHAIYEKMNEEIEEKSYEISWNFNVTSMQLCASDPSARRGQCLRDSGGPLVVDGVLTGIVSYSSKLDGCGSPNYPGVFTRVSEYIDWINKYIK